MRPPNFAWNLSECHLSRAARAALRFASAGDDGSRPRPPQPLVVGSQAMAWPGDDCGAETEASYLERTSAELLDELKDAARRPDRRSRAQDVLEKRAEEDRLRHLVDLHKRTTYELDAIARDEADLATRRAIAKQVLDERMALAS